MEAHVADTAEPNADLITGELFVAHGLSRGVCLVLRVRTGVSSGTGLTFQNTAGWARRKQCFLR
jgi:hypothetical protein